MPVLKDPTTARLGKTQLVASLKVALARSSGTLSGLNAAAASAAAEEEEEAGGPVDGASHDGASHDGASHDDSGPEIEMTSGAAAQA